MKLYFRISMSVVVLIIAIAIIDFSFQQGAVKYVLIGLVVAIILSYNKKKTRMMNRE
jgi:uncharacterized membrane protein